MTILNEIVTIKMLTAVKISLTNTALATIIQYCNNLVPILSQIILHF